MKTKWLLLMVAVVVGLGCAERGVVYSYVTFTNTVDEVREVVITNTVTEYVTNVVTVVETNVVEQRVWVQMTVTNYVQVAQAAVAAPGCACWQESEGVAGVARSEAV